MAENKIVGYKRIFGFVLPDWVSEKIIRNIVVALLSMVVMIMVLVLVIWPNFDKVASLRSDLGASKKDLEVLKSSSQGLDRIKTDLSSANQALILASMPTQYSPDSAIYSLRRISADTGVSIVSYSLPSGVLLDVSPTISTGTGGEMVGFVAYPVRITVEAQVESLLDFISKVESSIPFGVVADLNLQEVTKLSRSTSDKTVQLAMEIRFFQSVLKSINVSKIQPLTAENLSLARELVDYNLLVVPEVPDVQTPDITGTGSIFGF